MEVIGPLLKFDCNAIGRFVKSGKIECRRGLSPG